MLEFIYIFDIAVAILYFGWRGSQNGALAEMFDATSALVCGMLAYGLSPTLMMSIGVGMNPITLAFSMTLIFILVRLATLYLHRYAMKSLYNPSLYPVIRQVGGLGFGAMKGVFYISAILLLLSPDCLGFMFPMISEPIRSNSIVSNVSDILKNITDTLS